MLALHQGCRGYVPSSILFTRGPGLGWWEQDWRSIRSHFLVSCFWPLLPDSGVDGEGSEHSQWLLPQSESGFQILPGKTGLEFHLPLTHFFIHLQILTELLLCTRHLPWKPPDNLPIHILNTHYEGRATPKEVLWSYMRPDRPIQAVGSSDGRGR